MAHPFTYHVEGELSLQWQHPPSSHNSFVPHSCRIDLTSFQASNSPASSSSQNSSFQSPLHDQKSSITHPLPPTIVARPIGHSRSSKRLAQLELQGAEGRSNSKDDDPTPASLPIVPLYGSASSRSSHAPQWVAARPITRSSKDEHLQTDDSEPDHAEEKTHRGVISRRPRRRRKLECPFHGVPCCRPRNAYILFIMRERPRLVAANPHSAFGQISKLLGQTWRNMSDAEKEPYRIQARDDMSRYHIEVEEGRHKRHSLSVGGQKLLFVFDISSAYEWLSKKLPRWANFLSVSSFGSNLPRH